MRALIVSSSKSETYYCTDKSSSRGEATTVECDSSSKGSSTSRVYYCTDEEGRLLLLSVAVVVRTAALVESGSSVWL